MRGGHGISFLKRDGWFHLRHKGRSMQVHEACNLGNTAFALM